MWRATASQARDETNHPAKRALSFDSRPERGYSGMLEPEVRLFMSAARLPFSFACAVPLLRAVIALEYFQ